MKRGLVIMQRQKYNTGSRAAPLALLCQLETNGTAYHPVRMSKSNVAHAMMGQARPAHKRQGPGPRIKANH
jgi:hypothetical protein